MFISVKKYLLRVKIFWVSSRGAEGEGRELGGLEMGEVGSVVLVYSGFGR